MRKVLILLLAVAWWGTAIAKTTIYRDKWGVPHIYADSEEAALFALGYAQAEDRLEQLLKNYLHAEGKMASVFGEQFVEEDYRQRLLRHGEIAKARYGELDARFRKLAEAFAAGIKHYMKEHPEKAPEWSFEPQPYQLVALGRFVIWGWPAGQALSDLGRRLPRPPAFGSNEWAVSPKRSAEECVITCIDPHVSWHDAFRWYEAHVHGGRLNVYGFAALGTPAFGLGHNDYCSWACTTGGPDTADVYEEEISPDDPLQYRYDGQWKDIQVLPIEIDVKTKDGKKTVTRKIERTHHGPIVVREGNRAYAIKLAYEEEVGLAEQIFRQNTATNLDEFKAALAMNQLMPQNVMYGDVHGNIYYCRTGMVPIRQPGYDYTRPLPGYTSKTEWLGIHKMDDLVQILNPPQGFMQNCNISPDTMMPGSFLTGDRYPDYIWRGDYGDSNQRGRRAVELLGSNDSVTVEEAIEIALDTYIDDSDKWCRALNNAWQAQKASYKPRNAELPRAVEILSTWDGRAEADRIGATLFCHWRRACRTSLAVPARRIESRRPLPETGEIALLSALDKAVSYMKEKYASIEVPWGNVMRIRRGEHDVPCSSGGPPGSGMEPLRAVGYEGPDENGKFSARSGQSCTTVVIFRAPGKVESYSAVPFGQSDDPNSPHYFDQARELFSKKKLKPTYYNDLEALKANLESKKELDVPSF
jgi:acyl-homoserine lactone acylase PvdQ